MSNTLYSHTRFSPALLRAAFGFLSLLTALLFWALASATFTQAAPILSSFSHSPLSLFLSPLSSLASDLRLSTFDFGLPTSSFIPHPSSFQYCTPPLCLAWSSTESDATRSVAWGDYDGDGDLDLAVGNYGQPNRLYRNDNGALTVSAVWSSAENNGTTSVAWGDYDGDGDLDLAVGNDNGPNRLYRNDNGTLTPSAVWSSTESDQTYSVAWGDYDGDGDLDLAVGNIGQLNRLYRNDDGTLTASAVWSSTESDFTTSVAWGDYDGDGDLDLAVGNGRQQPNLLYRNDNGTLTASAVYSTSESDSTTSVAWGDYDGDGDLDLAVGNDGQPNRLYRNDDGTLTASAVYSTTESDSTNSVAWGDYDGDSDLDLAVGNGGPNRLYRNDNGTFTPSAVWSSTESDGTSSVAWGDYDGDGDLDLAVGNSGANRLYRNEDGTLTAGAAWSSTESDYTWSVAWGDYDGDGDLDLAVGNYGQPNRLYRNDNGTLTASAVYSTTESDDTYSVAWGDYDGDGDLDLAVGNSANYDYGCSCYIGTNRLYRNDNGVLTASAVWSSTEGDATWSVAWGDYDGDGDLDLAVGNAYQPNRLYRNDNGTLTTSAVWSSIESDRTTSVAWGDYDGDGDLDLAVGNFQQPNRLYRNDNGALTQSAVWSSTESDYTTSVAWGDVDGDGDLDLAIGNGGPNRLYRNDNGTLTTSAAWSSTESDGTYIVAWGDYDGDGDLDLAVGNGGPNRLYRNDNGTLTASAVWSSTESDYTYSVAWGDYDGDGDLDLAVGNYGQPNRLYRNTRDGRPFPGSIPNPGLTKPNPLFNANFVYTNPALRTPITPITYTLSDPEADNVRYIRAFYSLNGGGQWYTATAASATVTQNLTTSVGSALKFDGVDDYVTIANSASLNPTNELALVAWVKLNNPANNQKIIAKANSPFNSGYILAVANNQIYPEIWDTTGTDYAFTAGNIPANQWTHLALTWKTGDWMKAYINGILVYSVTASLNPINGNTYAIRIGQALFGYPTAGQIDDVRVYNRALSAAEIQAGMMQAATGNQPNLKGYWRFDEGTGTVVQDSSSSNNSGTLLNSPTWVRGHVPVAMPYVFNWDTSASGFFGQSDNVVFRIEAYPSLTSITNSTPVFQRPYASATTFPFRVRGTQVQVLSGTQAISNAIVYRLPKDVNLGGALIGTGVLTNFTPFHTDGQGYLQGRGQLNLGDKLLALVPITWTDSYTLYYTSGTPTLDGLDAYTMTQSGVQTLTVSSTHPLILFNPYVSLEWDAHTDTNYLDQLKFNLQRASEYLYDFTNGQVALGHVTVEQNADEWAYTHIVIHASNRLRPLAAQGGVVSGTVADPQHSDIIYSAGQVRMGATWNRYGTPGANIGDDWAIILAHELSHYLFYLDDTYLGLQNGLLVAVASCKGSAMGDLYSDSANTEFIADENLWQQNCSQTLTEQTLHRNEWETIQLWYPALITPTQILSGPSVMPFDFTTVEVLDPITPTTPLPDPTFYLNYAGGGGSSTEARAYLLRSDSYVIDLGAPFSGQNRVRAWGAQATDRLCVFDRPRGQFGCESLQFGDDQITLRQDATWNPIIQLSPVNSTTLNVQVQVASSLTSSVQARLYPEFGAGTSVITLTQTGDVYSGTFTLDDPTLAGHVQVWVDETATEETPRRESIIAFAVGGNPGIARSGGGIARSGGGIARSGGGIARSGGGIARSGGGIARSGGAPLVSPDGQMIFFTENPIIFNEGQFYTIQGMAGLPDVPPGRVVIGQGYRLVATPGTPVLTGSVSVQYLANDVSTAGAAENQLTLYVYTDTNRGWVQLPSTRDEYFNLVTAPSAGVGLYALMASVQIPFYGTGWNLVAYPVAETRLVTEALRSISGTYTTVYGYVMTDTQNHWRLYDVTIPPQFDALVNTLRQLEYGHGYWINVTQPITLYLTPKTPTQVYLPDPPATFYGMVTGDAMVSDSRTISPAPGQSVTAWVNGAPCGQGATQFAEGQVIYAVQVPSECAGPGQGVTFTVDGREMAQSAPWVMGQVSPLALTPSRRLYLPLVILK